MRVTLKILSVIAAAARLPPVWLAPIYEACYSFFEVRALMYEIAGVRTGLERASINVQAGYDRPPPTVGNLREGSASSLSNDGWSREQG